MHFHKKNITAIFTKTPSDGSLTISEGSSLPGVVKLQDMLIILVPWMFSYTDKDKQLPIL
jgi:hypothetical protein